MKLTPPHITHRGVHVYRAGHDINGNSRYVFHSTQIRVLEPDVSQSSHYAEHLAVWRKKVADMCYGKPHRGEFRDLGDVMFTGYAPKTIIDHLLDQVRPSATRWER